MKLTQTKPTVLNHPATPANGHPDQAGGGIRVSPAGRGGGTDGLEKDSSKAGGVSFLESALCELSGLALSRFQEARQKMRGGSAWTMDHGRVAYSQFGAEMVLGLVGCTPDEAQSLLQKCAAGAGGPALPQAITARVQRLAINRRVLFATRLDNHALVKVLMERPKAREELSVGDTIPIWPTPRPDEFECRLK